MVMWRMPSAALYSCNRLQISQQRDPGLGTRLLAESTAAAAECRSGFIFLDDSKVQILWQTQNADCAEKWEGRKDCVTFTRCKVETMRCFSCHLSASVWNSSKSLAFRNPGHSKGLLWIYSRILRLFCPCGSKKCHLQHNVARLKLFVLSLLPCMKWSDYSYSSWRPEHVCYKNAQIVNVGFDACVGLLYFVLCHETWWLWSQELWL